MQTGHKPSPPRCTLARMIQEPLDVVDIKTRGWIEQGILVVDVNDSKLNMIERQMITGVANKLYGKRNA